MSRVLYMAFAILIAIGGLAFYVRNDQEVLLNFFVGSVTTELSLALVGTLVLGAVLGVLAMTSTCLRLRREVRRLNRHNEIAGRELASLRAITLKDAG